MANRKRPSDDVEDAEMADAVTPESKVPGDGDVSVVDEQGTADDAGGEPDAQPDADADPDERPIDGDNEVVIDADISDEGVDAAADGDTDPDDEVASAGDKAESAEPVPVITPWGGAAADINQRSTSDPNSPDYVAPVAADPAPAEADAYEEYEDDHPTLASRVLIGLLILIAGGVLFLWGAPKVAPHLPPFMAPVAEWLVPGERAAQTQLADAEARLAERIEALELGLDADAVDVRIEAEMISAEERMATLTSTLSERVDQISDQVAAADSAPIEERLGQVEVQLEGLRAEMDALRADLSGVAENADGAVGENAAEIDSFAAALGGLRAELALLAQQNGNLSQRIDDVSATAERQIAEANDRVSQAEAAATAEVMEVSEQADMIALRNALATGAPYTDALAGLAEQVDIPQGLSLSAATGVPTQEELEATLPDLAHSAIQNAIAAEGAEGGMLGNASAFLRARMAGRSLTELEGTDTDAVLSRIEARLREQDLDAARAEAAGLNAAASGVLSGWLADLDARADALASYDALSSQLDAAN